MSSTFNPTNQEDIDRKIAVGLERIAQVLKSLIWQASTVSGLSPIQIQFLTLLLHTTERISIGFLASHFALSSATVSDAVTALEHKGLIVRARKREDRRTVYVSLSRKGKDSARKLSAWADALTDKVSELGPAQKAEMLPALIRLINAFQVDGVIRQTKMCVTCKFFSRGIPAMNIGQDHCARFDQALASADLRVDCPEHQP